MARRKKSFPHRSVAPRGETPHTRSVIRTWGRPGALYSETRHFAVDAPRVVHCVRIRLEYIQDQPPFRHKMLPYTFQAIHLLPHF